MGSCPWNTLILPWTTLPLKQPKAELHCNLMASCQRLLPAAFQDSGRMFHKPLANCRFLVSFWGLYYSVLGFPSDWIQNDMVSKLKVICFMRKELKQLAPTHKSTGAATCFIIETAVGGNCGMDCYSLTYRTIMEKKILRVLVPSWWCHICLKLILSVWWSFSHY